MQGLTIEQKKAVEHKTGPACVIAGAGTGKTFTLAKRIEYLVKKRRFKPSRILVTTFTRKATAELYRKAYDRLGKRAQQLRITTIDALIGDLARRAAKRGLMSPKRVIQEAEQRVLLLQCAWETFESFSTRRMDRRQWAEEAGRCNIVGQMETYFRAETSRRSLNYANARASRSAPNVSPFQQCIRGAVATYFEKLGASGETDYQLLAIDCLRCLKEHEKIGNKFASEFSAILVDEFQDTSDVQAELLLLLAGKRRNIWVVGDPCQQIYEWRGAGPENMLKFIRKTKAKRYCLTGNYRSTQAILDCAHGFLAQRVPDLKKNRMLNHLERKRERSSEEHEFPVFTGTLDDAFWSVGELIRYGCDFKLADVAILSRNLTKTPRDKIAEEASLNGLKVQFHSSRADHALEETIGEPPAWRPGKALDGLYKHRKIRKLISRSLRNKEFVELRTIRPIASAAEALDSTLSPQDLSFREAWPALKKIQDREISVSAAVDRRPDHVQVMTIHAAKGLEFPVVILMKLTKGGSRWSFPNPKDEEHSRLVYVGATRARDLLILVHGKKEPTDTLAAFGQDLARLGFEGPHDKRYDPCASPEPLVVASAPPLVAAGHLNLYGQCPLKFAAYHEGRFLPKWTPSRSVGSRLHSALEYYLRAGMPGDVHGIEDCFDRGFRDGDSPLRKLDDKTINKMRKGFRAIAKRTRKKHGKVLAVEERYRYVQGDAGQVEGVVDAVVETRKGVVVLKEWKTEIEPSRRRQYELQARAGVLGVAAQGIEVKRLEITPVLRPEKTISIRCGRRFMRESKKMLEEVFKSLQERSYNPRRGSHCKRCQLKEHCPAHRKK